MPVAQQWLPAAANAQSLLLLPAIVHFLPQTTCFMKNPRSATKIYPPGGEGLSSLKPEKLLRHISQPPQKTTDP
jgi:hypothetical protein